MRVLHMIEDKRTMFYKSVASECCDLIYYCCHIDPRTCKTISNILPEIYLQHV